MYILLLKCHCYSIAYMIMFLLTRLMDIKLKKQKNYYHKRFVLQVVSRPEEGVCNCGKPCIRWCVLAKRRTSLWSYDVLFKMWFPVGWCLPNKGKSETHRVKSFVLLIGWLAWLKRPFALAKLWRDILQAF